MKGFVSLTLVLVFSLFIGCSTGGNGDETISVTDSRGFEKTLTPAGIAYQSAQQFLSTGNYDDAIRELRKATSLKPDYLEATRLS